MVVDYIEIKPGTRNHHGYFIQEIPYRLVDIDRSGWALICMNEVVCYYVDPDNLETATEQSLEV
ncbi:hypothetical protein ACN4EK_31160 [Pantanalinema rosaneae CENA516]|uniref:hypothetical protein n=1 Tax=Pantanalinema rosaneae TaxID=1620701 RepID=UPI003D6FC9A8